MDVRGLFRFRGRGRCHSTMHCIQPRRSLRYAMLLTAHRGTLSDSKRNEITDPRDVFLVAL